MNNLFSNTQSVFKFLWEDKLNKYLPSFLSLLLQVSVHILSYQRSWASKRKLSHLPPLMRWNVNRDLKEERKQPLQASGWKAFQKDSSVCVEGLDSGASWRCLRNSKETSVAAAESIRERWQRRGHKDRQGQSHTAKEAMVQSWDDWKWLDSSDQRSDVPQLHFLVECGLLDREQMILGQEQKQENQLGGHCSNSGGKRLILRRQVE